MIIENAKKAGWITVAIAATLFLAGMLVVSGCENPVSPDGNNDSPDNGTDNYAVSGSVTDAQDNGISGVNMQFGEGIEPVLTNEDGAWSKDGLIGSITVTPNKDGWTFDPPSFEVSGAASDVDFTGTEAEISFAGGDGTEGDPYQVATAAQLNGIRNQTGSHFVQTADIDLSDYAQGEGWEPIGPIFGGSYDGGGYTISSLSIDRSDEKLGLFQESWGGVIRNVTLTLVDVTGGGNSIGALVGINRGTIEDCTVDGSVTQLNGALQVGGLVGQNYAAGTITASAADVTVTGNTRVGGLVGSNAGTIESSSAQGTVNGDDGSTGGLAGYNTGTITGSNATSAVTGHNSVGGLVGSNDEGNITDSYAAGLVTGTGDAVGGLVGSSSTMEDIARIAGSHATGDVVSTGASAKYIGGLVGFNNAEIEECYATGSVSGEANHVGGLVGTAWSTESEILRSYAGGTVQGSGNVGGFVGSNGGTIRDCYTDGSVEGSSSVGGFAGQNRSESRDGTIAESYAAASVAGDNYLGGFVGYFEGAVNASYWDTGASGIGESAGGEGRTTAQMQAGTPGAYINPDGSNDDTHNEENLMYDGWDSAVWTFGADGDYPMLQWQ